MPILNVDNVLHEEMENKDVLLNSFEFLVEDDARIGSDIDINNTPQSMTDQVACRYMIRAEQTLIHGERSSEISLSFKEHSD